MGELKEQNLKISNSVEVFPSEIRIPQIYILSKTRKNFDKIYLSDTLGVQLYCNVVRIQIIYLNT